MRYLSAIIFSLGIFFLLNSGCKKDMDVFIPDPVNDVDSTQNPIPGCVDSTALNFNATATTDDGSCVYDTLEIIWGCIDTTALNYNELADMDDGSCLYEEVIWGCTDQSALNYEETATHDDGSCLYITGDIQNFFDAVQQPGEILYINNDINDFCVNSNNTIFHAPQGLFSYPNGNIVEGQVEIEIIELHSKGDLIRYTKPTMSDGNLIYSDGVLYISASQNGQPVEFTPGYITNIQMPSPNENWEMNLFYGEETTETFNWEWQEQGTISELTGVWPNQWIIEDTLDGVFSDSGYGFWIDRLDWINCDAFADIPEGEKTTVCVELHPEIYTNQNAAVFMVLDDINAVVQLWGDSEQMKFNITGMPIGEEVTFIVIASLDDDEYDFAMSSTTLTNNHLEELYPLPTPLGDIQNALDGL